MAPANLDESEELLEYFFMGEQETALIFSTCSTLSLKFVPNVCYSQNDQWREKLK